MGNDREDRRQTPRRDANAARPLDAAGAKDGPERYPSVRQDDAVEAPKGATGERPSFDPSKDAPSRPPQGAGDTSPPAAETGRLGPGGDPAEGKR